MAGRAAAAPYRASPWLGLPAHTVRLGGAGPRRAALWDGPGRVASAGWGIHSPGGRAWLSTANARFARSWPARRKFSDLGSNNEPISSVGDFYGSVLSHWA